MSLFKNFSEPGNSAIAWALDVIEAVRDGDVYGRLTLNNNGYKIEFGENITKTEIVLATGNEAISIESKIEVEENKPMATREYWHPHVKSMDDKVIASSIHSFSRNHKPQLKYEGMRNAVDVLTACKDPNGDDYNFHYDVDYRREGVYIVRRQGPGYRTSKKELDKMRKDAGFRVNRRKRGKSI